MRSRQRRCQIYNICSEFEKLFACSADGGLTKNGVLYKRTMSNPGTCQAKLEKHGGVFFGLGKELTCPEGSSHLGADFVGCRCVTAKQECRYRPWYADRTISTPSIEQVEGNAQAKQKMKQQGGLGKLAAAFSR